MVLHLLLPIDCLEHELHDIELKHVAVLNTNKSLQQLVNDMEKEKEVLHEQSETNRKRATELGKAVEEAKSVLSTLKEENQKLSQEKLSLIEVVAKKDSELEALNATLQEKDTLYGGEREESIGTLLNYGLANPLDLKKKYNELEIAHLDLKLSYEHIKNEKELLATHTEWLNGELTTKSAELLRIQSERSSQITSLEVRFRSILQLISLANR